MVDSETSTDYFPDNLLNRHPYIISVLFMPNVIDQQRDKFEAVTRQDDGMNF